jgi:hypothetical protein
VDGTTIARVVDTSRVGESGHEDNHGGSSEESEFGEHSFKMSGLRGK